MLISCYFLSCDGLYVQIDGATMGSSLGPVAVFMSHFEREVLRLSRSRGVGTPSIWLRYVDDVILFWPDSNEDFCKSFV